MQFVLFFHSSYIARFLSPLLLGLVTKLLGDNHNVPPARKKLADAAPVLNSRIRQIERSVPSMYCEAPWCGGDPCFLPSRTTACTLVNLRTSPPNVLILIMRASRLFFSTTLSGHDVHNMVRSGSVENGTHMTPICDERWWSERPDATSIYVCILSSL